MAKTFQEIVQEARSAVPEVSVDDVLKELDSTVLVDVREKEEYREGHLPKAISLPRGFLEMQVEGKVPDKKLERIIEGSPQVLIHNGRLFDNVMASAQLTHIASQLVNYQINFTPSGMNGTQVGQQTTLSLDDVDLFTDRMLEAARKGIPTA